MWGCHGCNRVCDALQRVRRASLRFAIAGQRQRVHLKFLFQLSHQPAKHLRVARPAMQQHNVRLAEALSEFTFPQWPYAGPIAIRETHPDHGWQRAHVFHRWRYYGSAKTETEMHELAEMSRDVEFDADIFKLLLKRLAKGGEGVLRLGIGNGKV